MSDWRFDNVEEVNHRLVNTIVLYDGKPHMVLSGENHEDGVMRIVITPGPDYVGMNAVRKKVNSPKFDRFRPFELGYLNLFTKENKIASWCTRPPARNRRQGLSAEVFSVTGGDGRPSPIARSARGFDAVIRHPSFIEMVEGTYPAYPKVMETLVNDSLIAVDRNFAIGKTAEGFVYLYYQAERIGLIIDETIFLRGDYNYLRETIVECNNLPNNFRNI